jgi:Growth inhibitor
VTSGSRTTAGRCREQGRVRPCVVLSGAALNDVPLGIVMATPITGTDRGRPSHIEISTAASGLRKLSWAMAEQFRATSVRRLKQRLGYVDDDTLERIQVALLRLLHPR